MILIQNQGLLFELPEEYISTLRNADLEVDADFQLKNIYQIFYLNQVVQLEHHRI